MEMAKTAGKMEPETSGMDIGVEEWLQPRHWGAPPDLSMKRVSERLAVMVTEKGLEEYRRSTKARKGQTRHPEPHGSRRGGDIQPFRQSGVRNLASTANPCSHPSGFHLRNSRAKQPRQQQRPGMVPMVRSSKRGEPFVGGDGVLKRPFPSVAGSEDVGGRKVGAEALSKREDKVVRRLCDPKLFTGTAATGHLPTTVDLEGGVGVLLKDASITVKDHVGAQEVSWRLRLAERL